MHHDKKPSHITPEEAGTLFGLFYERVQRSPHETAYRYPLAGGAGRRKSATR